MSASAFAAVVSEPVGTEDLAKLLVPVLLAHFELVALECLFVVG